MTSMMMLEITMEVSINTDRPLKGRAQAWLGHLLDIWKLSGHLLDFRHFWKLLADLGTLGIGKLYSLGPWAKFTKEKE